MSAFLIFLATLCLLSALFAATTIRSLRHVSLHELNKRGEQSGRKDLVGQILHWQERIELTAEVVHALSLVGAAGLATWGYVSLPEHPRVDNVLAALGFVLAMLIATIVLDVWVAAPIARVFATKFIFHTWSFWRTLTWILRPLTYGIKLVEFFVYRLTGYQPEPPTEETLEDEIRTIVNEGHREGLLEEDAREMIEGVMELGDAVVSEIMTPRPDMLTLTTGATLQEAAAFFVEAGHSRIPVYDKQRDEIVGVLYIKDLLEELLKPEEIQRPNVNGLLRPPVFVPESKPVDDLLQDFQRQRNHIAIVLNEFGGVAGLVTIEDVLEEIVGEIIDEHDEEEDETIQRIDEKICEIPARTHLEEINEELGLDLEVNGVDTIGGLVFSELGHVPRVGEQLTKGNVRITVLEVKHRRVERVRLEILDETPAEQPQEK